MVIVLGPENKNNTTVGQHSSTEKGSESVPFPVFNGATETRMWMTNDYFLLTCFPLGLIQHCPAITNV